MDGNPLPHGLPAFIQIRVRGVALFFGIAFFLFPLIFRDSAWAILIFSPLGFAICLHCIWARSSASAGLEILNEGFFLRSSLFKKAEFYRWDEISGFGVNQDKGGEGWSPETVEITFRPGVLRSGRRVEKVALPELEIDTRRLADALNARLAEQLSQVSTTSHPH